MTVRRISLLTLCSSLQLCAAGAVAAAPARLASAPPSASAPLEPPRPGAKEPAEGPYGPEINDEDPEAAIPDVKVLNRDPIGAGYLLMELSSRAERYYAEKNWPRALAYYRAISRVVPDRALSFAKQCELYRMLDQPDQALPACRKAIGLVGTKLADYLSYGTLLLDRTPDGIPLPQPDVAELDALFEHLQSQNAQGPEVDILHCRLAAKLEDALRMRRCVEQLQQKLPHDPVTLAYQFSLTLLDRDFDQARGVVDQARQQQLPAEAVTLMEQELAAREHTLLGSRVRKLLLAFGLPAAVVAAALGLWRRRRRAATA